MNYKLILRLVGRIMLLEAAAMVPPLLVSVIYKEAQGLAFVATIALLLTIGCVLSFIIRDEKTQMRPRDGFLCVGLVWIVLSVFGALPFVFSGAIPHFIDALFETASGFTTTGSSILQEIESLPRGILFWRSFTHFLGGMGVLILALAILPESGRGVYHLMRAEAPGPSSADRIVPKLRDSAKIMYLIYVAMSAVLFVLLLFGGMDVFDALTHTFSTAGTGGFNGYNNSISHFDSLYIETVLAVFMLLFSINFGVYFALLTGRFLQVKKFSEWKVFVGMVSVSIVLIVLNLMVEGGYTSPLLALRHTFFYVASIVSTTGFGLVDFNLWPDFSRLMLLVLMAIGACAGSTGGGIKVVRVTVLYKSALREIKKIMHPRSVNIVRMDEKNVPAELLDGVLHFIVMYVLLLLACTLLVSLDNLGILSSFTAVLTCISNVGPGLDLIGPTGNFSVFSDFSKIILTLCMLLGRLEIFPILLLFFPATWKRETKAAHRDIVA